MAEGNHNQELRYIFALTAVFDRIVNHPSACVAGPHICTKKRVVIGVQDEESNVVESANQEEISTIHGVTSSSGELIQHYHITCIQSSKGTPLRSSNLLHAEVDDFSWGAGLNPISRNARKHIVVVVREFPGTVIAEEPEWKSCIQGSNTVVNLAGLPISTRWPSRIKKEIKDSRIRATSKVVNSINDSKDVYGQQFWSVQLQLVNMVIADSASFGMVNSPKLQIIYWSLWLNVDVNFL